MTSNEIRSSFLKFFESREHRVVPSSPLVPGDDPTLLFTNAGMNQFKDLLLGREKRSYKRAATSQKVMRVSGKHNDLDNVGPSHRHHTFFEMLGNFSFGDYFKEDALPFAWELLTDVWKMEPSRMVVSIFKGENGIPRDAEAYDIWRKLGVPADRILELGSDDNFWSMGDTGPCGRCSEIYYVRGGSGHDPEIEIWNNVFMEFERSADGRLTPLPAPSIDTGMGLERITAVLQEKESNYDTDVFQPLLHRDRRDHRTPVRARRTERHLDARRRRSHPIDDVSHRRRRDPVERVARVRAAEDHAARDAPRQAPGADRAVPAHARRRPRSRYGRRLPGIRTGREMIERSILAEEHRFEAVLTEGLPRLEAELAKVLGTKSRVLGGDAAFKLYDTFGVPFDFIEDTATTQGVAVDKAGYERAMEGQRGKARAKSGFKGGDEPAWFVEDRAEINALNDAFRGYETTTTVGVPIAILYDDQPAVTDVLREGQTGWVILPETPFYLEAGGQVSDTGRIHGATGEARRGRHAPDPRSQGLPARASCRVVRGELRTRDIVTAEVDVGRPRRHAAQPHGDTPAPRGAAPGARLARQAGGFARGARSPALRLRALPGDHTRRSRSHRAHRQRAGVPQHAGEDGRRRIAGAGRRGRRDGVVRREIRRQGPRRQRARLQHGAVRRHARAPRPATSGSSRSSRKAASRRAFAGSKP